MNNLRKVIFEFEKIGKMFWKNLQSGTRGILNQWNCVAVGQLEAAAGAFCGEFGEVEG